MISSLPPFLAFDTDTLLSPIDISSKVGAPLTLKLSNNGGLTHPGYVRRNLSTSSIENQSEQSRKVRKLSTPSGHHSSRYKTEKCRSYVDSGFCKYGDKCQFAHGNRELRLLSRHPRFKTELCRTFHSTGFCPYGPRCHFIHSESDRLDYDLSSEDVMDMWQQYSYSRAPQYFNLGDFHQPVSPTRSCSTNSPQPSICSNDNFNGSFDGDSAVSPTSPHFNSPIDDLVTEIESALRNQNENFCPTTPGNKRLPIFSRLTTTTAMN